MCSVAHRFPIGREDNAHNTRTRVRVRVGGWTRLARTLPFRAAVLPSVGRRRVAHGLRSDRLRRYLRVGKERIVGPESDTPVERIRTFPQFAAPRIACTRRCISLKYRNSLESFDALREKTLCRGRADTRFLSACRESSRARVCTCRGAKVAFAARRGCSCAARLALAFASPLGSGHSPGRDYSA